MKTLYLECNMGAAGDMLTAALLELHNNPDDFLMRLNNIGIPGVTVTAQSAKKCGITGTHIEVSVNGQTEISDSESHGVHHEHNNHHHECGHSHGEHHSEHNHSHEEHHHEHNHSHETHHHNSYHGIEHLVSHLKVSENVKKNTLAVYKLIAEAESRVHGVPVSKIHFHEVGEMDAVADIVGFCMLVDELAPDVISASPINVGSGQVRCAHGVLPVPAPAAAYILQNVPIYSDETKGELCTPTGAAILKHFVRDFCAMPVISVTGTGYGMGIKDFEKANCIRAFIGNVGEANESVTELVCNLDDMTPEALAFAQQVLFEEGALDVCTAPLGMKKGRTGFSLTCMCRAQERDKMLSLIFKHTTTLGIREYTCRRYVLEKEQTRIETDYGVVRAKTSHGFGVRKTKLEYEDIAKIAHDNNKSIQEILMNIDIKRFS